MVAYRETIRKTAAGESKFEREMGGKSHFAQVVLKVAPAERSAGNRIEFDVSKNIIPDEYRHDIEESLRDALSGGIIGNYALVDTSVTVTGGAFDPVSSSDVAFRSASAMALRTALRSADPAFLEPIMFLEIVTPTEYIGEILGDVNSRGGHVDEIVNRGVTQTIRAMVPLAKLFGYATAIRSLTKGRAMYTMEPARFEIVSEETQKELLSR